MGSIRKPTKTTQQPDEDRASYLRRQSAVLAKDMESMRADASWTALSQAYMRHAVFHEELAKIAEAERAALAAATQAEDLTPEELVGELIGELDGLPAELVDKLHRACGEVLRPKLVGKR
jgi:hypothetical protein